MFYVTDEEIINALFPVDSLSIGQMEEIEETRELLRVNREETLRMIQKNGLLKGIRL